MVNRYIPKRGDIIWVNLNPTKGHEQKGKRPALVISPETYNKKSGLCILVPITSKSKKYPFEVEIKGKEISGHVMSDQVKSIDYVARKVECVEKVDESILSEVLAKVKVLVE